MEWIKHCFASRLWRRWLLAHSWRCRVPRTNPRWKQINAARILENIKVLSSDEYEGRAPASKGETLATAYIEDQFKKVGLKPGNPDGTYFQSVPMVGIKADPSAQLVFTD